MPPIQPNFAIWATTSARHADARGRSMLNVGPQLPLRIVAAACMVVARAPCCAWLRVELASAWAMTLLRGYLYSNSSLLKLHIVIAYLRLRFSIQQVHQT